LKRDLAPQLAQLGRKTQEKIRDIIKKQVEAQQKAAAEESSSSSDSDDSSDSSDDEKA
jgi:hypothetical protein